MAKAPSADRATRSALERSMAAWTEDARELPNTALYLMECPRVFLLKEDKTRSLSLCIYWQSYKVLQGFSGLSRKASYLHATVACVVWQTASWGCSPQAFWVFIGCLLSGSGVQDVSRAMNLSRVAEARLNEAYAVLSNPKNRWAPSSCALQ